MTRQEEIQKLKEEKDAVILAHYYVRPEVQEKGGRSAAAHDCVLRGVLYGGECQAAESVQNSADARCRGRLSDGAYGREGDHREGARAV